MSSYVSNVYVALLLFPFLSALLVLPYAIFEYRKYGSIPWWKTILVFSCVFYLMCAYFMVILPLPADRNIYIPSVQTPQLVPFAFVRDIIEKTSLNPASPHSWLMWLKSPDVYTVLFNFLLTMPFGIYLRYLMRRPWWQALLAGFGLALFFEVSQGTGLFGIYAHPYRLFDVDDLITNTTGAMLGYWAAIPLCHFLPRIDRMNTLAVERAAARTSFTRRLIAFGADSLLMTVAVNILAGIAPALFSGNELSSLAAQLVASGIVFVAIPAMSGATLGHKLLRLRVVQPDGSPASRRSIATRYLLLFWCFLLLPQAFAALAPVAQSSEFAHVESAQIAVTALGIAITLAQGLWWVSIAIRALMCALRKRPFVMLNGLMTNTRVYSAEQIAKLTETSTATPVEK